MSSTTGETTYDTVLLAIVEKLAAARDADPLDLPPLNHYIDTDALVSLVDTTTDAVDCGFEQLRFRVDDYQVSVAGDGTVDVVAVGGETGLDRVRTQFN